MIDFHSHILPGIDDGSTSVEMSVEMLRMEAQQGISRVIATPHFYPHKDQLDQFLLKRERAEEALRGEMAKHTDLPEILLGAEVRFFRGISDSEYLDRWTIQGTNCILIEMHPLPWSDVVFRELEAIWEKRGIHPVVAHIDRYVKPLNAHRILKQLSQVPLFVQASASFFTNKKTASLAMRMLKADQIHLLGSDCHNLTSRKPNMGETIDLITKKLGADVLERISGYENNLLNA